MNERMSFALASTANNDVLPLPAPEDEVEQLEVELLLEAIFRRYGYDFRSYSRGALHRRIKNHLEKSQLHSVTALLDRILRQPATLDHLLADLSVSVTSMFRDPSFFAAFRREVVPLLHTYPYVRIWHAGCATGEEVYSMCILLEEEGLGARSRLYATDLSAGGLAEARRGIFPLSRMQEYTRNYLAAGGKRAFSDYYTTAYEGALFDPKLARNVLFTQHDLAVDASFAEFNVVVCRNVLIYFGRELKERVLSLFVDSLAPLGVLCLGYRETLRTTLAEAHFTAMNEQESIYRRVG